MSLHSRTFARRTWTKTGCWRPTKPCASWQVDVATRASVIAASTSPTNVSCGTGAMQPYGEGVVSARLLTFKLTKAKSVKALMTLIAKYIDEPMWNEFHLGATYVSLVRLRSKIDVAPQSKAVPRVLASKTQDLAFAKLVDARGCVNILWAIATLKETLPELTDSVPVLLASIQDTSSKSHQSFTDQGLANIAWAAAILGLDKDEVEHIFVAIFIRLRTAPCPFTEQALSNIFWAAATL
eukprot:6423919-Amphidinium_carterae.1